MKRPAAGVLEGLHLLATAILFTASFWLDAIGRVWIGISPHPTDEGVPFVYILRVVTYALIVVAIVDKNRSRADRPEK